MSNIKEIYIEAVVPWNWAERLPDQEAACFASLLLNPVIGIRIEQHAHGYVDNEHGGRTSMYKIVLSGSEALSHPFLRRLVTALAVIGTVTVAECKDLEENLGWEYIHPTEPVRVSNG